MATPKKAFLFISVLFLSIFLITTCDDMPMGMGDPVDWEPPVLTLDPIPVPYYVRGGAKLSGTVTDNIAVERVLLRDAITGETLFPGTLLPNDRYEIVMNFDMEKNGVKISAEIIAFDKMGNSALIPVTLIIDLRPPVIEDIWIQRTVIKQAYLESFNELKSLETSDPRGERSANANRYQNGFFQINAKVSEEETRIEIVSLNIYDAERDMEEPLLTIAKPDEGSTFFTPRWLINEEVLLDAGALRAQKGEPEFLNYKQNYYNNDDARYYYHVAIVAIDKSKNESEGFIESEGFFCMWAKADEPKGIIDPVIGGSDSTGFVVTRGTPLPVEFFDDDALDWAYTGLLTEDQWLGLKPIADGASIDGTNNNEKLEWLRYRLVSGGDVYNWKFDKYSSNNTIKTSEKIIEQIGGNDISEKIVIVQTGNQEADYGDFVLFTLVRDKKLPPHPDIPVSAANTMNSQFIGRAYTVQVIDENIPLIVFDTVVTTDSDYNPNDHTGSAQREPIVNARTGNSPEENTFPGLDNGRYFEINGYTLRENTTGLNDVTTFRMAWIPFNKNGGPDSYIRDVQAALRDPGYPAMFNSSPGLAGIQHWNFTDGNGNQPGHFVTGTNEIIGDSRFQKKVFKKKFDILGEDPDDINSSYRNFTYNTNHENETKLFVFCAIDNMGHVVYRQLQLLGNKTPPTLDVYDISGKLDTLPANNIPSSLNPNGPPSVYDYDAAGEPGANYYNALKTYNDRNDVYTALKNVSQSLDNNDLTIPYQTYTRGTTLKYWVMAERSGDLAIKNIQMFDITDGRIPVGSNYHITDRAISFCEFYPDVTQRVFLFVAEDTLGNTANIQRTIAINNAARLESITTTSQNGTYGIGEEIILRANFTGLIRLEGSSRPELNIRYSTGTQSNFQYTPIQCEPVTGSVLTLQFRFTVPENAVGVLETMYGGLKADDTEQLITPIHLPVGTSIMDSNRNEPAFIPGYRTGSASMPNWTTDRGSLQSGKTITLDGVRPNITSRTAGGKTAYAGNDYYFRTGETIELTLFADKPIRPMGTTSPRLQYNIERQDNGQNAGPYNTHFVYSRPSSTGGGMVFTLPVNSTSLPFDGKLVNVSLVTGGGAGVIADDVGNTVTPTTVTNLLPAGVNLYVKQTLPPAPATTVGGSAVGSNPATATIFNANQPLVISASSNTWEDVRQFSVDGGSTWSTYVSAITLTAGQHELRTRYLDRAGNEGNQTRQLIHINSTFPSLIGVKIDQPSRWYRGGENLSFTLDFDDAVRVNNAGTVTITVTNRAATNANNNSPGSVNPSFQMQVPVAPNQTDINRASNTSISFNWNNITGKEMRDGLYISNVTLTGLTDRFGNAGAAANAGFTGGNPGGITLGGNTTANLPAGGARVDDIAPAVTARTPGVNAVHQITSNTITLTFSEPVMKGAGTITIRPRGNYAIPPVFRDEGYWVDTGGTEFNAPGANRTYIPSLFDVYNNNALLTDDRAYLVQGASLSSHTLNVRTGQSEGPYRKITHGLTEGPGYTGNYGAATGANGPNPGGTFMIPDTSTKWVLDFPLTIHDTAANSAVSRIRATLTKAKFRWQEIGVVSTSITGNVVTITLNEPLLPGLDWDVCYPAGTFTDMAGNSAAGVGDASAAISNSAYYFQSSGVQTPVIRVNRRSYDARTANWQATPATRPGNYANLYSEPANTANWNTDAIGITNDNGWGIQNFRHIHYRVESETPNAVIRVNTHKGVATAQGSGAAIGAWTGTVQTANPNAATVNTANWNDTARTAGTWVVNNIIRRAGIAVPQGQQPNPTVNVITYTVQTKNGTPEVRTSRGDYRGLRSYNRDYTRNDLNALVTDSSTERASGYQGFMTFDDLEASKSYVVARATRNGATVNGYEGIFRTVIVLNQTGLAQNSTTIPNLVEGSNIKNGMPSIAGFPVRDAEESGDNRFIKVFFRQGGGVQHYWVSTEIVSEWYFLKYGGGGTHMQDGEVDNYMTVGYGDLTYGFNVRSY
ncbi:MAG: hypothetical protein LBU66_07995 [Treponema sp.]|nr:hypothetical protein [Treponema sp.]